MMVVQDRCHAPHMNNDELGIFFSQHRALFDKQDTSYWNSDLKGSIWWNIADQLRCNICKIATNCPADFLKYVRDWMCFNSSMVRWNSSSIYLQPLDCPGETSLCICLCFCRGRCKSFATFCTFMLVIFIRPPLKALKHFLFFLISFFCDQILAWSDPS